MHGVASVVLIVRRNGSEQMLVAVTWTQLLVHAAAVAAGNGDNDRS